MSEFELDQLFRELNDEDPQRRLDAARHLTEMGEAGAAVLARALAEYPWLDEWADRLKTLSHVEGGDRFPSLLPYNFYYGEHPPSLNTPPLHVMQGLLFMGQTAASSLYGLLRHERLESRLAALLIFHRGYTPFNKGMPNPAEFVSELRRLLTDEDAGARFMACVLLSRMQEHAYPVIPFLTEWYWRAEDTRERMVIVRALIELHCPLEIMKTVVADFVSSSDECTQLQIFNAFHSRGDRKNAEPLIPFIMDYLHAQFTATHCSGETDDYCTLNNLASVADDLLDYGETGWRAFLQLAQNPDPLSQAVAIKALCSKFQEGMDGRPFAKLILDRIEPLYAEVKSAAEYESLLTKISQSSGGLWPEDEARWQALQRRLAEKRSSSEFVAELIQDLNSDDVNKIRAAAWKAEELQSRAEEVAPHLLQAMLRFESVDYSCKETLMKHAPAIIGIAPSIIAALAHNNVSEKLASQLAELLESMGDLIAHETPRLVGLLDHHDNHVRQAGLRGIMSLGPAALEHQANLIEILTGLLTDDEQKIARNAAFSLGFMGRATRSAVPQLMNAARSSSVSLVEAARDALTRIAYDQAGVAAS